MISPNPAINAAPSSALSEIDGVLTRAQAIAAGMQAAIAQAISIIVMWPTPVLVRKVMITEASIEKTLMPAAAAAEPATLIQVAATLMTEATKTAKTARWRQIAPPAGTRASREYHSKVLVPTTTAAPKVASALKMAKGSSMAAPL